MVILFIATLIDGVAMEKGDFHSREEIINIIARCKNSNRLIIHHFLDGLKPPLILARQQKSPVQRYGALLFWKEEKRIYAVRRCQMMWAASRASTAPVRPSSSGAARASPYTVSQKEPAQTSRERR